MATLSLADTLTPIEVAKRFGMKDQVNIIEALSVTDTMLLDAAIFEASDGTINKTTLRDSLPAGQLRTYGEGIKSEASRTRTIEDTICMLEDYSLVDADMANHSPDRNALLDSEDKAFLMGMGQTMTTQLIYGNRATQPKGINGLAVRYNSLAAGSVVSLAGASACTSAYLVRWGKQSVHLFYPKGHSSLGIERKFLGEQTVTKSDGTMYQAYNTFFGVHFGLAVRDTRCVKRLANITASTDALALMKQIVLLRNRMPPGDGNLVLYCNATVKTVFDQFAINGTYGCTTWEDPFGRPVTTFQGIRIRQVDELLDTESAVS